MRINASNMRQLANSKTDLSDVDIYLVAVGKARIKIRKAAEKGQMAVQFLPVTCDSKTDLDSTERAIRIATLKHVVSQVKASLEADGFTVGVTGSSLLTISWGDQ